MCSDGSSGRSSVTPTGFWWLLTPKETSRSQQQRSHINAEQIQASGSVQGHLRGTEAVEHLTDGASSSWLMAGKNIPKSECPGYNLALKGGRQPQGLVSEWHGAVCTPGLMLALTGMCFGPVRILCREEDPCMCCSYIPGALHGARHKSVEATTTDYTASV